MDSISSSPLRTLVTQNLTFPWMGLLDNESEAFVTSSTLSSLALNRIATGMLVLLPLPIWVDKHWMISNFTIHTSKKWVIKVQILERGLRLSETINNAQFKQRTYVILFLTFRNLKWLHRSWNSDHIQLELTHKRTIENGKTKKCRSFNAIPRITIRKQW